MSKYTGKTVTVDRSAHEISEKFSDLSRMQEIIDQIPESERAKLGNVQFGTDTIVIGTSQVGEITLKVEERTDSRIKFVAVGTPIPLEMCVLLKEEAPEQTALSAEMEVQIPAMLRPMVGPQLQKAVDMLTDFVANIAAR